MTEKTPTLIQQMAKSAMALSLYVLIGIGLLLAVMQLTKDTIAEAEKQAMLAAVNEVMPNQFYDNDPLLDTKQVTSLEALGTSESVTLYRARKNNQPAGIILETIAPDGYSGNIHILMGVFADGRIAGVRVIKHKETPGLGDKIEIKKSPWITSFDGWSLRDDNRPKWQVKKDGGDFDQFTGATITPRAIVGAVRRTLDFIKNEGDSLYD